MDFMINPIDNSSRKELSQDEGDSAQSEDIDATDTSPEEQLPDEVNPQSMEEVGPIYTPIDVPPLEEDETLLSEGPLDIDTSQETQLPGETNLQYDEGTEPAYTPVEVQPLEESDSEPGDDTGFMEAYQGSTLVDEAMPQPADETQPIFINQEIQPAEEVETQTYDEIGPYPSRPDQAQEENDFQPAQEPDSIYASQEEQPIAEQDQQSTDVNGALNPVQEVQEEANSKKIALILSGGGARGAFQVGAETYARQVKGYHWDIIAGVSVGALNGAMLAMHRYQRLMDIWNTISDTQVYTGGFNLPSVIGLLLGAKSFYGNGPLKKLMRQEFEAGKIIDDLHVGVVSLITGEYIQFTKEFLELPEAILASASIPVIWPPVDISPEHQAMVDGGVRNISPVGDVLALEPDEIVIINCSAEHPPLLPKAPQDVLSIGLRALDIMQNEIFVNDVRQFLRINALVKEAEKQGTLLHHPRTGRLLKYYPSVVIEPDIELGGVLDFSQASVQMALKAGVRRAREVFGKP